MLKQNIICFDTVKHGNRHVFYSVDTLVTAIEQKKKVSFLYYDLDIHKSKVYRRKGARYVVNPLALIYTNDKYYLVCYHKGQELRNYRIDRMEKVEVSDKDITPVKAFKDFNIAEYKQQAFSMFTGKCSNITLTVDNACINAVLDKFGESVNLRFIDEKTFSVTVQVQVSPTFFAWCLTSCQKITITAPQSVVKEYGEYVKSVIPEMVT